MKLFPTETEIKTALGDVESVTGPSAQIPDPSASPPANTVSSTECYEASFGTAESRADVPTRMFAMQSSDSDGTSYRWVVAQRPSADDIRKGRSAYEDRVRKCSSYETFDAGTTSGNNFAARPSGEGKVPSEGASAYVTSGNVSIQFTVLGPLEEAKELVKKMAPVMEKRLKASAPKS